MARALLLRDRDAQGGEERRPAGVGWARGGGSRAGPLRQKARRPSWAQGEKGARWGLLAMRQKGKTFLFSPGFSKRRGYLQAQPTQEPNHTCMLRLKGSSIICKLILKDMGEGLGFCFKK
jgi:hypothetical protein